MGAGSGAIVGAGSGLITWGASKLGKDDKPKGKASGLSYVPYDNYPAMLHRGERVLTAAENRQNKGKMGLASINININGSDKSPREIAKEVMKELYRELYEADMNMPAVALAK